MASLQQISTLISQRKPAQAATALRKLVRQKSKPGIDWHAAMSIAGQLADQDTALAAAQNWRAQSPADPQRIVAEITALGALAKHKEAAQLAHSLQQNSAAAADGYSLEGFYQARFGRREKALELCRKALAHNREHAPAWEQISVLHGYEDIDADIAEMLKVEKRARTRDQLLAIRYALGRAYDHVGDIDKAFFYISKAADLRTGAAPFDIKPVRSYLDGLRKNFNNDFIKQHENVGAGEGVIFILSLPRSGSTLIEQIASTARPIRPTSEHTILRNAALSLGGLEPQNMLAVAEYNQNEWRKIGQSYFEALRRRFGASKLYTDKTLINYCYAGLIRILFPAAKIIWLRRDPRDVAWSCYRTRLNGAQWTERLEATCAFINAHNDICAHWSDIFQDQLITVSYEELIDAPENMTMHIFNHIGIDRPETWNDFYKSADPVATNSLAQVREPLNKKGIKAWQRYEKHLTPIYDQSFN